jgi:hypothetical protein
MTPQQLLIELKKLENQVKATLEQLKRIKESLRC